MFRFFHSFPQWESSIQTHEPVSSIACPLKALRSKLSQCHCIARSSFWLSVLPMMGARSPLSWYVLYALRPTSLNFFIIFLFLKPFYWKIPSIMFARINCCMICCSEIEDTERVLISAFKIWSLVLWSLCITNEELWVKAAVEDTFLKLYSNITTHKRYTYID